MERSRMFWGEVETLEEFGHINMEIILATERNEKSDTWGKVRKMSGSAMENIQVAS
jgi:hypothetical protein